jgi:hypothetical protein
MGNLVFIGAGDAKRDPVELFLDFENAKPQTDEERGIYDTIAKVLDRSPNILQKLTNYTGCEEYIRKAISNPGPETEDEVRNDGHKQKEKRERERIKRYRWLGGGVSVWGGWGVKRVL